MLRPLLRRNELIIKSLELNNFRNYENQKIEFDKKNNILYGDNAQGKTNILEALFLCGTTKSHKGAKDREMIRIGCDEAHLRMIIEKDGMERKIDMHLKKNKSKGAAIDGIPIKKSAQIIGMVNMVFFSPEDLSIIKSGPEMRRKFIDMELCQLDKIYLSNLYNYNRVLKQRNNLLKQISSADGFRSNKKSEQSQSLMSTLDIWDEQLCNYGKEVIKARVEFINELSEIVKNIHYRLSGNTEDISMKYDANVSNDNFADKLFLNRERDIYMGSTSCGPHRDDVSFYIKETDIRKFGSQGQQRTSALSLKLSEIEIVKKRIKEEPILLLDDVLSELDRKRQNHLLNSIVNTQTIITCTGLEEFVTNRFNIDKTYEVVNGHVNTN